MTFPYTDGWPSTVAQVAADHHNVGKDIADELLVPFSDAERMREALDRISVEHTWQGMIAQDALNPERDE